MVFFFSENKLCEVWKEKREAIAKQWESNDSKDKNKIKTEVGKVLTVT